MATTIQDFFTRAAAKQFSRDFLFRVKQIDLVGNPGIIGFNGEDELVYAKTAALPGRNIENKLVNYFGQEFQVPGRAIYQNAAGYSIDFYHDENCDIRNKLEAASRAVWAGVTDNEATESKGAYGMPGNESVIILSQIDKQLREVQQIQLVGASIRDIGEISYTIAEGTGEVLTYNVTFAYHFYRDFSHST
jgi:hypothetical protein